MKRFPFVRAIFVSGELSKNSTGKGSDIDFFILTEPGRLWIARTLLILFKKVFLLNSRKFFCLNAFLSTDALRVNGEDIYIASEVAHLKALYNSTLCSAFMDANRWVTSFFPNFRREALPAPRVDDRRSLVQLMLERVLDILPLDRIDIYLQGVMKGVWERRYPGFGSTVREKIFRCSRQESRAYVGNFQEIVLAQYRQRLSQFGVSE